MFEVSWGELFVLTGASIALIGRKDLPKASHFFGSKIGQIVGLLQGARIRADKFASHHELRALQNELRSGLREIDAVKGELAIAASSRGLIGRGLGSSVGSNNGGSSNQEKGLQSSSIVSKSSTVQIPTGIISSSEYMEAARAAGDANQLHEVKSIDNLPPRTQSVAAVAEEEWVKQGIGFKSRAEMGTGNYWGHNGNQSSSTTGNLSMSGSLLLSELIQQSLIHDQYDRAVMEQDEILKSRVDKSQQQKSSSIQGATHESNKNPS